MLLYMILAILALLHLYYHLKEPAWSQQIPGVPCWPIIEHLFQIDPVQPHITFQDWAKKLGNVFKIRSFGKTQIIVNDYESVYEVMVRKSNDFAGREILFRTNEISYNSNNIGFQDFTPVQTLMKKLCMTGVRLGQGRNGFIENSAQECSAELIIKFKNTAGRPVDIREDLRMAVIKVIATLGFGMKLTDEDPYLLKLSELERSFIGAISFTGSGVAMDLFPWIRHFGGPVVAHIDKFKEIQRTAIEDIVQKIKKSRRERGNSNVNVCVMDPVLNDYEKEHREGEVQLTEKNVQMLAADLVIGGVATTSVLLYHMVHLMLHYPKVLKRAQTEVDAVTGSSRSVVLEDRQSMPYCQAVIFEALRHFSHVPLGAPHKTTKDTYVGKYFIPKGVAVMNNLWAIHHDEAFWTDPYEFLPDRFLDSSGQLVGPEHENRKRLLPFGAGRRVCPGEILALIRIFIFYTNIIQSFDILPPENTTLTPCDPRGKNFTFGVVTQPPAYKVRFISRQTYSPVGK